MLAFWQLLYTRARLSQLGARFWRFVSFCLTLVEFYWFQQQLFTQQHKLISAQNPLVLQRVQKNNKDNHSFFDQPNVFKLRGRIVCGCWQKSQNEGKRMRSSASSVIGATWQCRNLSVSLYACTLADQSVANSNFGIDRL